jgi:hypothetical protein
VLISVTPIVKCVESHETHEKASGFENGATESVQRFSVRLRSGRVDDRHDMHRDTPLYLRENRRNFLVNAGVSPTIRVVTRCFVKTLNRRYLFLVGLMPSVIPGAAR